jgi:hypothetical protein
MPLGGLVVAGIGSAVGIGKGIADLSRAKKIKPVYNPFEISESAKRMQGLAQAQLNARAPGAASRERGIQGSQANTMAAVGRGVTDSATALQMAAASQAQTGRELSSMQDADAQYYQGAIARLFGAEQNMQQQEAMKYQEDFRKYQMDAQMKEALRSEGFQGIVGGLQNMGGMMMASGMKLPGLGGKAGETFPSDGGPRFSGQYPTLPSLGTGYNPAASGNALANYLMSNPGGPMGLSSTGYRPPIEMPGYGGVGYNPSVSGYGLSSILRSRQASPLQLAPNR